MRLIPVRVVRPLFLAVAILSCASERAVGPTLTPGGLRADVSATASTSTVVISQVYGGGGNAGATLRNDFIELFNRSTEALSLAGWSVQYGSTAGVFSGKTDLTGSIAAGGYLLIQEVAGTGGTVSLPTPDATGTIAMAAGAGKVALVRNTTIMPCGSIAVPCSAAQQANIADLVGYGTGTFFEGTAPTGALANSTAAVRLSNGCIDTDDNATDFNVAAPSPRNGQSPRVDCDVPPPPPPGLPDTRFVELHYDNVGSDVNEAIEIEGPAGFSVDGWSVVLYNGTGGAVYDTRPLSGTIPDMCDGRGVIALRFEPDGIQNGGPDGLALVNAAGEKVEFLSYEGTFAATNGPVAGQTSVSVGVSEPATTPLGHSMRRDDSGAWQASAAGNSIGACNSGVGPPPPSYQNISFTGRTATDIPLPVGFQDQVFASVIDEKGDSVETSITWSAETPGLASIDERGVITALAAGTPQFRATTGQAFTRILSLPTQVPTPSTTALYGNNSEFGEPADGDVSDDFLVRRAQYTSSYNRNRGTPNWVSYNLDTTHIGSLDRCDCFTFDPALPTDFPRYNTADYTGVAAINGYGIDRGHLARSFDRTTGTLDNATTFYFSNIIPQASDLNQGPWAVLESNLGDSARFAKREVYIITGVAGEKGTVKNEGKITIPAKVWKVAVIMPRDNGLANVHDYADLTVIAVIMPNDPGVRNVDWRTYQTSVDRVEEISGYDVLSRLPDGLERVVESGKPLIPGALLVNPGRININGQGNGQVMVTLLGSSEVDAAAVDVESIRLGNVRADTKGSDDFKASVQDFNNDGIADLIVHFNRDDLVDDGQLTIGTTQLVLYADLIDGRHVEARGAVLVRSNAPKN